MFLTPLVLILSLFVDRALGDPHSRFHPVAMIGSFIGWWGQPLRWSPALQRSAGVVFWIITVVIFTVPFYFFSLYASWFLMLLVGPFLLKICFALRSLEEHAAAVAAATSPDAGREKVQMLVSRDTSALTDEQILSAAYESVAENLNDSIIAPLFYFMIFGLPGAAFYRAANTMDAMLGYTDERVRIGWFSARMDDILSYIPARITGLVLIVYFFFKRRLSPAFRILRRDRRLRPGFNGGIPMSLIAGGTGVMFEKPGKYRIGDPEQQLRVAGPEIISAVRGSTLIFAIVASTASVLWNLLPNI
ncbi:adenosylcobinamide-phosphate synthase CbiB [Methanospirillum lacunae]|uniref:Probable cobalamin biosynthesis protein CobD n=1 Tax=Methanospirillum lacunae TaxID=668570 RepID=A0A2V2N9I8_9EURY|nr:adenosylcobinamide-phosphate synthase CbiB [Methanospirillum lacunae]PWR72261.1 cobalamin biosynthesis protein CobD [Methanospirillum lacunae]